MAIVNGWCDWMERNPAPANKVNPGVNTLEFFYPHSAVARIYVYSRVYDPDEKASWHITFYQQAGKLPTQHYPITARCWATGNRNANDRGVAAEFEGGARNAIPDGYDEPLTQWQIDCALRFLNDLGAAAGRKYVRVEGVPRTSPHPVVLPPDGRIVEHNEAARWLPEGKATACPSGRMKRSLYPALLKGDAMTTEELARLERVERLLAGRGKVPVTVGEGNVMAVKLATGKEPAIGSTVELTGEQTLAYLDFQGNNFWLGLAATQNKVAALEAMKPEPRVKVIQAVSSALINAGEEIGRVGGTE